MRNGLFGRHVICVLRVIVRNNPDANGRVHTRQCQLLGRSLSSRETARCTARVHFLLTPFELSRWRGGRCAYAPIEAGVPPRNCTCLSVVMRCSIEPLPYPVPVRNRQIPVGRWYESTETLFKIHMVTRPPQAPAAHFKRLP
jgi:hypothetical protein